MEFRSLNFCPDLIFSEHWNWLIAVSGRQANKNVIVDGITEPMNASVNCRKGSSVGMVAPIVQNIALVVAGAASK